MVATLAGRSVNVAAKELTVRLNVNSAKGAAGPAFAEAIAGETGVPPPIKMQGTQNKEVSGRACCKRLKMKGMFASKKRVYSIDSMARR